MKYPPQSVDTTGYCRALGYKGGTPVRVLDGRVITHRNANWFEFCQRLASPSVFSVSSVVNSTPLSVAIKGQ